MRNKNLIKALPIVASALGKKHGIKVAIRSDIDTAATDGKTIYLPVLPDTDEALVLARGFIDHESAHIRYTNFKLGMGKGLRKALVNIMEDIRIEQLLGRELPGCRINLEALEKAFVDGNVYTPVTEKSHPANILTARIHHCLRVEVLNNLCTSDLAANAKRVFAKAFPPAMVQKVDELLEEATALRDTAHVCDLSDRILKAIQEEQPQQPDDDQDQDDDRGQQGQKPDDDSSNADDQDQNGQSGNSGNPDGGDEKDSEGDGSNAGDEDSDSDDESAESDQGNGSDAGDQGDEGEGSDSEGNGGNAGDEDDDPEDESNESDQGNGSDAGDQGDEGEGSDSEGNGGNAGDEDGDPEDESNESDQGNGSDGEGSDADGEGSEGADGGTSEDQEQNRQALLQSMDDEVEGSDLGDKVGKILGDLNYAAKMHGQNSGTFPMVLDPIRGAYIDPSEAARETNALRTRLNGLIQASKLKRSPPRRVGSRIDTRSLHKLRTLDTRVFKSSEMKVGVNTAALLLVDQSTSMSTSNRHRVATMASIALALALNGVPGVKLSIAGFSSVLNEQRDRHTPVVRPMKLFNQRIDKTAFVPVAQGGTPIAEALWWAASELLGLKHVERRMVFLLTDGQPDDAKRVQELVKQLASAGIECRAIGIGLSISPDLFPSNCSIRDVSDLPTRVFEMLQEVLVAKP